MATKRVGSRWIVGLVSVAALAATGVWTVRTLADNKRDIEARVYRPDPDAKVRVDVARVTQGGFDDDEKLLGTFEANRQVVVGAPTQGRVLHVGVAEGDRIRAGQIIAQLDASVLAAQLPGLEANLADAKRDKARYEELGKHGAIALQQVDKATLALTASESQLATLKRQVGQTTVVAPFAGVVTERHFDVGAVIGSGARLIDLVDISKMKLVVLVPERDLAAVENGKKIDIVVDAYAGKTFPGTVTMVGVQGDGAHNFPVHVMVPNDDATPLRVGMYGAITLSRDGASVVSIPRDALVGSAKAASVYVVENGVARLREITVGRATADRFEVVRGVKPDDVVVVSGQINLRDGAAVSTGAESDS